MRIKEKQFSQYTSIRSKRLHKDHESNFKKEDLKYDR